MSASSLDYVGSELELFAEARRWKSYWASRCRRFVSGRVLEVGAGLGGSTRVLRAGSEAVSAWTCVEPDRALAAAIEAAVAAGELPADTAVVRGTLAEVEADARWNTILYVDVVEHIEDDRAELAQAAAALAPGGHLLVLVPAHEWLRSPLDDAVGHHRRYDRASLLAIAAPGLSLQRAEYLDCLGTLLSLGNRWVSGQRLPTPRQIAIWDRWVVPLSRVVDPLLGRRFGKSLLCVWQKD